MVSRTISTTALNVALLFVIGCPPAETKKDASPPTTACTKFGASCEVSPGKLGTCVEKTGCTTGDCFICQSQH